MYQIVRNSVFYYKSHLKKSAFILKCLLELCWQFLGWTQFRDFFSICQQQFGLRQTFYSKTFQKLIDFCFFYVGCFKYSYIENTLKKSSSLSANISSHNSHFANWISLCLGEPKTSETFMEASCQVETKLTNQTKKLKEKMRLKLETTRLKAILNLVTIKLLWNQIQIHLKIYNTITVNPWFPLLWDTFWRNTKSVLKNAAKVFWSFLFTGNSGLKRMFRTETPKNSKLQINYYGNKNWNTINCCNRCISLTL